MLSDFSTLYPCLSITVVIHSRKPRSKIAQPSLSRKKCIQAKVESCTFDAITCIMHLFCRRIFYVWLEHKARTMRRKPSKTQTLRPLPVLMPSPTQASSARPAMSASAFWRSAAARQTLCAHRAAQERSAMFSRLSRLVSRATSAPHTRSQRRHATRRTTRNACPAMRPIQKTSVST